MQDDEEPVDDAGPTIIQKFDDELPPDAVVQFGDDEPADVADEGNGVGDLDLETDDDEDIPVGMVDYGKSSSAKKSVGSSRGSTPKTPKSANKGTAGRKRKADAIDEPAAKRPGHGRATAAAASEAIKTTITRRPQGAPGAKVCHIHTSFVCPSNMLEAAKATSVKKAKPGRKSKKAAEESEEEYEVEAIRDSKAKGKSGKLYLVKWKGFAEKDNTWEPKGNLAHASELLKEYEAARADGSEEDETPAPAKKAAGPKKGKAKTTTKKVAPAKEAAKPATAGRGRPGRPKRT